MASSLAIVHYGGVLHGQAESSTVHADVLKRPADDDRALLRVFLASRGNMKELERHLGVSYPTARARFDALLDRMGLQRPDADRRLTVLEALARGEVSVDEAAEELGDDLSRS